MPNGQKCEIVDEKRITGLPKAQRGENARRKTCSAGK